ncbi:hypothetical protein [Cupriavidus basilensis]|uniref:hypothetical protein n=1 Tax=Cupriavidus basilensis TaxID=68895 RepID=UPI0039F697DF
MSYFLKKFKNISVVDHRVVAMPIFGNFLFFDGPRRAAAGSTPGVLHRRRAAVQPDRCRKHWKSFESVV